MRRTPSSGCYWGFVLCLRDTLYLFLAIAIIAYALRQIKFTQLLYFLYTSLATLFIKKILPISIIIGIITLALIYLINYLFLSKFLHFSSNLQQ